MEGFSKRRPWRDSDAALSGQPLPQAYATLSSAATYGSPILQGHLTPQKSDSLTYFGWPYPPLSDDGVVDSNFTNHCVPPDTLEFRVEVDSPVNVLFTAAPGQQFGYDASGKPVATTSGLALPGRDPRGHFASSQLGPTTATRLASSLGPSSTSSVRRRAALSTLAPPWW